MKIGKSSESKAARATSASYLSPVRTAPKDSVNETPAPAVTAGVLGIPEGEFTPRVRTAIMSLMTEVETLRGEIADARARLEDLARSADQDTMLPVLNRRAFVRELSRFIALAERYGTPSSLLYFDLDGFKAVNDTHGHAAGDAVLRHVAEIIGAQVRDTDVIGRIGGDEFGVILSHVKLEQATAKGERLAQALRTWPALWQGRQIVVGFSFGAHELKGGENADAAMAEADRAMYAKKRGR